MIQRRLTTILAADVAGFSRLTGADEEGTVARLRQLRSELIDPAIATHRGRLVKTTGDGAFVEFASVVDAVRCAVEVQRGMAARNAGFASEKQIQFRVGINLGDVVVEADGDLMGDGVNVAARLEAIAPAGGIVLSRAAWDQVEGKIDLAIEDLGEHSLKNIARPVHAYRVQLGGTEPKADNPLVARSEKPSIAVLPFQNMSGDPEQDYFADGMVEDIITALSRVKLFFVVARNSSFVYKGRAVDIKQVGRELGVRYVLEGSVRKAGNRVRITGQLIEAASGHHVWADRFEGNLEDIFALQDSVTASIVGAIEPSLMAAEIVRGRSKPTENLDAYDCFLRGTAAYYKATREGHDAAATFFERAIELDPHYASAKAWYADSLVMRRVHGWLRPGDENKGLKLAREVAAEAGDDATALARASRAFTFFGGDHGLAVTLAERALALNPNSAQVLVAAGWEHCFNCTDPGKAIELFTRAMRLSPRDPEIPLTLSGLAYANLMLGRDADALLWSQKAIQEMPSLLPAYRAQIFALVRLNRIDEARETADRMVELDPAFTIAARTPPYRDARFRDELRSTLKAAGLPD
ncbi:MAG TPA: adenylate/guanylate cyclase domain-containing protein [Candidatus Cybelea sp.]|nr:adenylate/guanylate cyclase domain-containing protein [Candidatus Cybelea sp.]